MPPKSLEQGTRTQLGAEALCQGGAAGLLQMAGAGVHPGSPWGERRGRGRRERAADKACRDSAAFGQFLLASSSSLGGELVSFVSWPVNSLSPSLPSPICSQPSFFPPLGAGWGEPGQAPVVWPAAGGGWRSPHQAGGQASPKSRSCSAGDIPCPRGPVSNSSVMNESRWCGPHSGARPGADVRNYPRSYSRLSAGSAARSSEAGGGFRARNCCFCACAFKKRWWLRRGTKGILSDPPGCW